MLRNRGSRFDTGWLVTFSFFFILVEKILLRNFLSVAKMASLVYERENCGSEGDVRRPYSLVSSKSNCKIGRQVKFWKKDKCHSFFMKKNRKENHSFISFIKI